MDDDRDVVRIVERWRRALEGCVVELPLRRRQLPDQSRKCAPVSLITEPPALGGKVELVPPLQLGFRGKRLLAGLLAADQITADGHQSLHAFGPQRSDDVGGPRAPVEPADHRAVGSQRVHQGDRVHRQRRRLAVAFRICGPKARGSVAPQIGHDHPEPSCRKDRRDLVEAVDVIGPAVQEDDRRSVAGTAVHIADVECSGVNLPDARRACGHRRCSSCDAQLRCGDNGGDTTDEAPPLTIDVLMHQAMRGRTERKVSRRSSASACGCSQAAKWVPLSWAR